ncbi:hypothetical protein [Desulfofundulus sp.]|uniref:hypothetical protein n=1 Tax=Desulfofundulus sp. TaxID=2282750 RepID=UPI003C717055
MEDGRTCYLLQQECLKEALPWRRGQPSPDYDPSLLEYLEEAFTRIELHRAETRTEDGSVWPVIVLGLVLSACLLFALSLV